MAEETQTDAAEATGLAALGALTADAAAPTIAEAPVTPAEPKIDNLGRSYATGRRKDAAARVWVKRGTGQMKINGRDVSEYFARPVLQMRILWQIQIPAKNPYAGCCRTPDETECHGSELYVSCR